MCNFNPKNDSRKIDPCMMRFIRNLNLHLRDLKTVASCCGHGKYPMTIVCEIKGGFPVDLVSGSIIPRMKRFYKKDKKGIYYIPETIIFGGKKRMSKIHKEDSKKKGHYLCNHGVGPGQKEKLSKLWKKVTCQNCLNRKKN